MVIFMHLKTPNAFPGLVYFTQRNSNWFLLPDLVSVKQDYSDIHQQCMHLLTDIFFKRVTFTASLTVLVKCSQLQVYLASQHCQVNR